MSCAELELAPFDHSIVRSRLGLAFVVGDLEELFSGIHKAHIVKHGVIHIFLSTHLDRVVRDPADCDIRQSKVVAVNTEYVGWLFPHPSPADDYPIALSRDASNRNARSLNIQRFFQLVGAVLEHNSDVALPVGFPKRSHKCRNIAHSYSIPLNCKGLSFTLRQGNRADALQYNKQDT